IDERFVFRIEALVSEFLRDQDLQTPKSGSEILQMLDLPILDGGKGNSIGHEANPSKLTIHVQERRSIRKEGVLSRIRQAFELRRGVCRHLPKSAPEIHARLNKSGWINTSIASLIRLFGVENRVMAPVCPAGALR